VDNVLEACSRVENANDTDLASSSSSSSHQVEVAISAPEVSSVVRKELAVSLRDLMHHGLVGRAANVNGGGGGGASMVPFIGGCMSSRAAATGMPASRHSGGRGMTHAWDVILRFYELKMGHEFNSAPARKLSQSFGLDLSNSTSTTGGGGGSGNRQALLTAVGHILATHAPYKRSPDAMFKALVCAGLNRKRLIPWLRLVLRNQAILDQFYAPWSYVVKTGFDDGLKAVERLNLYAFHLPVDVAVKQFQQMNEAF